MPVGLGQSRGSSASLGMELKQARPVTAKGAVLASLSIDAAQLTNSVSRGHTVACHVLLPAFQIC